MDYKVILNSIFLGDRKLRFFGELIYFIPANLTTVVEKVFKRFDRTYTQRLQQIFRVCVQIVFVKMRIPT